jgi:hypothetical protein
MSTTNPVDDFLEGFKEQVTIGAWRNKTLGLQDLKASWRQADDLNSQCGVKFPTAPPQVPPNVADVKDV